MNQAIDIEKTENTTARAAVLEQQLQQALHRAAVAEERLQRVTVAVRAFKERQLAALTAGTATSQPGEQPVETSGIYRSWAANDPSLDERLTNYLDSDFEPDSSRDWMLG